MNQEGFKRKLTAILSADVAGYSRLMAEDESATVKTLAAYREVMASLIKQHRGRVVDSPGDNVLAEFASVVDAVQCGVSVQKELQARNADLPENRRMQFRIGINLGDVIEEEDRIYGDGVNVAARLEGLADPGGICISKTAFDQIETKLPLGYEYLGEQPIKNIPKPVGAYRVLMEPRVTVAQVIERGKPVPLWRRKLILAGGVALIVLVIAALIWNFYFRPPPMEVASVKKMAFPLPDKPSIAVLPFVNMSKDPNQEYLVDGIAENIISALSQVPKLFVIARNSTFTYKRTPVKVQKVAEDLGVQYVLEGSVQRSGDSLRIIAQLIDALGGHHLWSERYDRKLKDIFALQDEITMKVITALQVKLTDGELARLSARGTENLQAYLKLLEAREIFYTVTKEGNAQARRLLEEVIAIDPEFPAPYITLGATHFMDVRIGSTSSPQESLKKAFESIKKAIALDDSQPLAHSLLGFLYVMTRQHDKGLAECERAITLAPNSADAHTFMGLALTYAGRHEEAVRHSEQSLRLNPMPPGWYFRNLGLSYFGAGRYEEAIAAHKKALQLASNDIITHIALTTAYSWAGRLEEARAQAEEILRINPKISVEQRAKMCLDKNPADSKRYLDGLRMAGLPETPPLPLPDKPSIAVLPFVNMSGDPDQEYFSDGITEEIITALSKTPKLFVIARTSSFTYRGKPVKVQQVGRELGVKYVLEGSVRKAEDKVRITAQLVQAQTGHHLWAERYDRDLKDIFAVQDEITKNIITALQVQLTDGEQARVYSKGTDNLQAYVKAMEGWWYQGQSTRDGVLRAQKLAEEAIDLDPNYAFAYYLLGAIHSTFVWLGLSKNLRESLALSIELHRKAIALDNSLGRAYAGLGYSLVMVRQYDEAIAAGERAVSLEPNSAGVLNSHASILMFAGRNEEAIPFFREALRLNPKPPNTYYRHFGNALANIGQYEEAIALQKKAIEQEPNDIFAYMVLASVSSMAGREAEAKAAAKEILRLNPHFSVAQVRNARPDKDRAVAKRWCDTLREAGLPE